MNLQKWMVRKIDENEGELNIMPVLDILSTLVVFLVIVAVWFQPGVLDFSSLLGKTQDNQTGSTILTQIKNNGTIEITLLSSGANSIRMVYKNLDQWSQSLPHWRQKGVKKIRVFAEPNVRYQSVVKAMDEAHRWGFDRIQMEVAL